MRPSTSTAVSFYSLAESLPPEKNLSALRLELEQRLRDDRESMTTPELQLLDGLRLREACLPLPFFAEQEKADPTWWIDLKGSALARVPLPA